MYRTKYLYITKTNIVIYTKKELYITMAVKRAILDVLGRNDSTIKWIHFISKHSENTIRVTLNRDLKSNNIVIETNNHKDKYKIYTLNTPKNVFKYISRIRSRYIHLKWRIYEQEILAQGMNEFIAGAIKSLNDMISIVGKEKSIEKALNLRNQQLNEFLTYKAKFKFFMDAHQNLLEKLNNLYETWKNHREIDVIDPTIQFNDVFLIEKQLKAVFNAFKKKEKTHKKFVDNLKQPKF